MNKFGKYKIGDKVLFCKNFKDTYYVDDENGITCSLNVFFSMRKMEGKIGTIKRFSKEWTTRLQCAVFEIEEYPHSFWIDKMLIDKKSIEYLLGVRECTK